MTASTLPTLSSTNPFGDKLPTLSPVAPKGVYASFHELVEWIGGSKPEGASKADAESAAKHIESLRTTAPATAMKLESEVKEQFKGINKEQEEKEKSVSWEESLAKVAKFFTSLTEGGTWIRVLEVIGGGLLLLFGLWIVAKRELPKAVPV